MSDISSSSNSYLSFKVGEELFSAHVSKVLNILEMTKITKVPKAPPYMLGVINLRGTVLPVIDTRIKFDMPVTDYTSDTCIIVSEIQMDGEIVHVGALVDSVQEVLEISKDEILPPPSIGNRYRTDFIQGVMNVNEEFIMLLDMDKVFSTEEVLSLKDTARTGMKQKEEETRKAEAVSTAVPQQNDQETINPKQQ